MKKISIILSSLVSVGSATPVFKSGFKAGVGIGYQHHTATLSKEVIPPAVPLRDVEPYILKKSGRSDKTIGDINFGYDFIKNKIYSAIEFDYRFGSSTIVSKSPSIVGEDTTPLGGNDPVYDGNIIKDTHKKDFGITSKIGYLVRSNLAIYAIGNIRYGKFITKMISRDRAIKDSKIRYNKIGFGGGLGCSYLMHPDISVGLDVTYDIYKNKKKKINQLKSNIFLIPRNAHYIYAVEKDKIFNAIVKLTKKF